MKRKEKKKEKEKGTSMGPALSISMAHIFLIIST